MSVRNAGAAIRDARKKPHLTQEELSEGICSILSLSRIETNSTGVKLSKIENDQLQPEIILAEALLQRLGISEHIFNFGGNNRENELHEMKSKLIHAKKNDIDYTKDYLTELNNMITPKDNLYYQYYLYKLSREQDDHEKKEKGIFHSLLVTLPYFHLNSISSFRLSFCELNILNSLLYHNANIKRDYNCIIDFNFLLSYWERNNIDIIFSKRIQPTIQAMFIHTLYVLKHYKEVITSYSNFMKPVMKCSLNSFAACLFYYAQALGQCGQIESVALYAHYSYGLNCLCEHYKNASNLKDSLLKDFNIYLN